MGSVEIVTEIKAVVTDNPEKRTLIYFKCPHCGAATHVCASCCDWGCEYKKCVLCNKAIPLEWVEEVPVYPDGYYKNSVIDVYYKKVGEKWYHIEFPPSGGPMYLIEYRPLSPVIPSSWEQVQKSYMDILIDRLKALTTDCSRAMDGAHTSYLALANDLKVSLRKIIDCIPVERI